MGLQMLRIRPDARSQVAFPR